MKEQRGIEWEKRERENNHSITGMREIWGVRKNERDEIWEVRGKIIRRLGEKIKE